MHMWFLLYQLLSSWFFDSHIWQIHHSNLRCNFTPLFCFIHPSIHVNIYFGVSIPSSNCYLPCFFNTCIHIWQIHHCILFHPSVHQCESVSGISTPSSNCYLHVFSIHVFTSDRFITAFCFIHPSINVKVFRGYQLHPQTVIFMFLQYMYSHLTDSSLHFVSSIHPSMWKCFGDINSIIKLLSSCFFNTCIHIWQIHHCILFHPSIHQCESVSGISTPSSNCYLHVSSIHVFTSDRFITAFCFIHPSINVKVFRGYQLHHQTVIFMFLQYMYSHLTDSSLYFVSSIHPSMWKCFGDINSILKLLQSKLFITSLFITEYSISDLKLLGTDLVPLKFPLYNRIFT